MPPLRKEGKIRKYICYLHNCTKRNLGKVTQKLVRLVISRDGGNWVKRTGWWTQGRRRRGVTRASYGFVQV